MIDYNDDLACDVFGDTEPALARMRATARAEGCRIVSALTIDREADVPENWVPGAPALIELQGDSLADGVVTLLDRVQREAEEGRQRSIVAIPRGLIDLVFARVPHTEVVLLCEVDEDERRAAIASARLPMRQRLHDIGREDGSQILQQISENMGRMASILASMSDQDAAMGQAWSARGGAGAEASYVRAIIRVRRLRDQYFRSDLFADPAWDILLDLMAARLEGTKVAVSSLCIAAAVPATTALRWIKQLTDHGLLVRVADPEDGRRIHIELSEDAARALGAYLAQARRMFLAMV